MLRAAIVFFVLGLIGILLGATGFAGVSLAVGKTILYVFLFLSALTLISNIISKPIHRPPV